MVLKEENDYLLYVLVYVAFHTIICYFLIFFCQYISEDGYRMHVKKTRGK